MIDDGSPEVADLPGDPTTWTATVRDCLRFVRGKSPTPAELSAWWAREVNETSGDDSDEAVERRLAFLEAADLLDRSTSPAALGRHGREYLDSHDEAVLYKGLAAARQELETVLEALAIRPLTDVEVGDLLAAERDGASIESETARTHRQWLQALGFLERNDGVNELTRRGRQVIDAAGGPAPPEGAVPAGESPFGAPPGPPASPGGEAVSARGVPSAGDELTGGRDERSRTDDRYMRELKSVYDDTCAICGDRRRRADGEGVSRVHHLMPPAEPHCGPERPENAIVVCPNHRADLDGGAVTVDPRTHEIEHAYESEVTGRTLTTAGDHEPGAQYLAYHDAVIAGFRD